MISKILPLKKNVERGGEEDWRLVEKAYGLTQSIFPFFCPSHTISEFCTLAVIVSFELMNHFR